MRVDFSVLNQKITPALYAASYSNIPSPGYVGRIFFDTDNPSTGIYRDMGTSWLNIAGGASTTPNLQQVTDIGFDTTKFWPS